MQNNVVFRELLWSDLPALEDVIRKTWHYDRFATPKTAAKLAKAYLAACLANQTYACVAEVDGVPAGLILGKHAAKHRCPIKYRLRQMAALCRLFVSRQGRQILRFYKTVHHVDQRLLAQCKTDYPAEVALFALAPGYRGLGIGQTLFDCLLAYMKSEHVASFYLYTDTSCNFGFYEHQGMTRRQQCRQVVDMQGQRAEVEFYLYDMAV